MLTARSHEAPKTKAEGTPGRPKPKIETADRVPANPLWHQLATRVQAKLTVSAPDNPYEQEADRVADQLMRMPSAATPTETVENSKMSSATESGISGVLGKGQALPDSVRAYFEPRLGYDFSRARIHANGLAAASAKSVNALAYTVGRDVVFGAGRYAPSTSEGKELLAHELVHVIQNEGGAFKPTNELQITPRRHSLEAGRTLLARQTWGTASTMAPPAKNVSPGDVFRAKLRDEVALFANAGVIVYWIVSQRAAAGGATVTSFMTASLLSDAATMKRLKPQPMSAAELLPALEMLEYYDVIKRKGPDEWDVVLAPLQPGQTQQDVNRADFDKNRTDITAFQQQFETQFDTLGHPIAQIAQQQLLEDSLAGGGASEFAAQKTAETNLATVTAELDEFVAFRKKGSPIFRVTTDNPAKVTDKGTTNILLPIAGQKKPMLVDETNFDRIEPIRTGASPEVEARRKDIEKRLKTAERALYNAQAFHRFATEMVWFLHELDKTSSIKFRAGTYPRHGKFGEYAADIYPSINENSAGFYDIAKAEPFVDDINTVAEAGHPVWGKFAWQVVYNDTALQTKINAKYGPRMSSAPHHGPAPDKLHMHLDIRPLNVVADSDTGFGVKGSGRVVLY